MKDTIHLICPLCGQPLQQDTKRLFCPQHHSFDTARQGYSNLLPVQQKHSLNPGDTKEMLLARRRFLDKGFYEPISRHVAEAFRRYLPHPSTQPPIIADIGCGEGYYTAFLQQACQADMIGLDIAKDGVRMACSRNKNIVWLVATASKLPIAAASLDGVCAMFSLFLPEEYARVLKKDGCAVEVTVGSDHLRELKAIIYEEVFEQHKHPAPCGDLFTEVLCTEQRFSLTLPQEDLQSLLQMTPHFWRIRQDRRQQLARIGSLTLTAHYWLRVLRKR